MHNRQDPASQRQEASDAEITQSVRAVLDDGEAWQAVVPNCKQEGVVRETGQTRTSALISCVTSGRLKARQGAGRG